MYAMQIKDRIWVKLRIDSVKEAEWDQCQIDNGFHPGYVVKATMRFRPDGDDIPLTLLVSHKENAELSTEVDFVDRSATVEAHVYGSSMDKAYPVIAAIWLIYDEDDSRRSTLGMIKSEWH